jgi:DNA topoisomerase-1
LSEILKSRKALKDKKVKRVVFYEITEGAVKEAVAHPRSISDGPRERASRRGRALDYLVGFNLSPLLWKKDPPRPRRPGRGQSPRCG